MTVTSEQAQMLTTIAVAIRPHGAPRWDAPGVMAAIKKVAHLDLADVTRAVSRAAEDRDARTPAVIASLTSPHWRDRDRPAAPAREPFTDSTFCGTCGEPRDRCERRWAGDHEFESVAHARARKGTVDISPVVVEVKGHVEHTHPVPSGALHEPEDT